MLKVRITYVNNDKGKKERDMLIGSLEDDFELLSKSKEYVGRGESIYNNIYLDLEKK